MAGTSWALVEPVPTTATRFPLRSRSLGQRDEWHFSPWKVSSPGQSGNLGWFSRPTALTTTSKRCASPSVVTTSQVWEASSQVQRCTPVLKRKWGVTPNRSAVLCK